MLKQGGRQSDNIVSGVVQGRLVKLQSVLVNIVRYFLIGLESGQIEVWNVFKILNMSIYAMITTRGESKAYPSMSFLWSLILVRFRCIAIRFIGIVQSQVVRL